MNLRWTNWLVLSLWVCLKQLHCLRNGLNKWIKQSSWTIKTGQRVPKHLDGWAWGAEHPFPVHELRSCFLTKTNISTDVLYIPQIARYLFVFIYLFGLWFWMHIYAYIYYMLLSLMWRLYCYSNLAKIYFFVLILPWVFFTLKFYCWNLPKYIKIINLIRTSVL